MEIQQKENARRGKFFMEQDGQRVAAIVYARSEGSLVIEHTEVDPAHRGRNIGYQLVQRVVEQARSEGIKVTPVCPFAKALFEKEKDWQDMLAQAS